jgi:hypothetical protein
MQVFISYASENAEEAEALARALDAMQEARPWLDRQRLLPGVKWEDEILNALDQSQAIIILLSTQSVTKAGFVQVEIKYAIDLALRQPPGRIFLIPVRLDECQVPYRELRALHYVDLFPDLSRGVRLIAESLQKTEQVNVKGLLASIEDTNWIDDADPSRLAALDPAMVIGQLDRQTSAYAHELKALQKMVEVSHRAKSPAMTEYIFRIHEVVKRLGVSNELPECYGVVLSCCKLLPPSVRSSFMRDVFDHLAYGLNGFWARSWWADLTMRDVVKHYIASNIRRHEVWTTGGRDLHHYDISEDRQVFERAVSLMRWDVALADLIVFYHWRNNSPYGLMTAVNLIESALRQPHEHGRVTDFDVRFPGHPDVTAEESEAPLPHDMLTADNRENLTRLGILVRAGEYMSWSEDRKLKAYGREIQNIALADFERRSVPLGKALRNVRGEDRRNLFNAIELSNYRTVTGMLPADAWRTALQLVREGCYQWSAEFERHLPVPLPGEGA